MIQIILLLLIGVAAKMANDTEFGVTAILEPRHWQCRASQKSQRVGDRTNRRTPAR